MNVPEESHRAGGTAILRALPAGPGWRQVPQKVR